MTNSLRQLSLPDGLELIVDDAVVELRLDRPERKNAINAAIWQAFPGIFHAIEDDREIHAVILTAAGPDFSAGADISEFSTLRKDAATARIYEATNSAAFRAVRHCRKPVIAGIRGICFGGGFGLAAAADIRIATHDARFCVPAARLGLAYPQDAVVDIVSALGSQMARLMLFSAGITDAEAARSCGFLAEVVENGALDGRLTALARQIAANAPLSVAASKAAIRAVISDDPKDAEAAAQLGDRTFDSEDYAEGRAAFAEKRTPVFTGK